MIIHMLAINLNHFARFRQGLFLIINSFHIHTMNCQFRFAGVALMVTRESQEKNG